MNSVPSMSSKFRLQKPFEAWLPMTSESACSPSLCQVAMVSLSSRGRQQKAYTVLGQGSRQTQLRLPQHMDSLVTATGPGPPLHLPGLIQTYTYVPSSGHRVHSIPVLPSKSSRDTRCQNTRDQSMTSKILGVTFCAWAAMRGAQEPIWQSWLQGERRLGMSSHLPQKEREGHCHGSWLPPRWGLYSLLLF